MKEKYVKFTGTIPENYEKFFVPVIFEKYAEKLADKIAYKSGMSILETACGTGAATRRILKRLPDGSRLIATDFNDAMLVEAAKSLGDNAAVKLRQANAMKLPFDDDAFDAVVCQFGVMFFPTRTVAYKEVARVLNDGGTFHFNVWDSLEHNHFAKSVHEAAAAIYPDNPPDFFELPYGYNDISLIVEELQQSGFADIDITVRPLTSSAKSARYMAMAYGIGSPLANEIAERATYSANEVVDLLEVTLRKEYGDGGVSGLMQAFQISAKLG